MENSETQVWLDFSVACDYIQQNEIYELEQDTIEIGKMLKSMIDHPEKFLPKNQLVE